MSFSRNEAIKHVAGIQAAHKCFFRLAAYDAVGENSAGKLTHFPQPVIDVEHANLRSVFEAFRKRKPMGRFGIAIVCGDGVPASPPDNQRVRQRLAKMRGTFKPKQEPHVLMLDTIWLDKAFDYRKAPRI